MTLKLKDITETEKDFLISLEFDNQVIGYYPANMEIRVSEDNVPEEWLKLDYWVIYRNKFKRVFYIYETTFNYSLWNKITNGLSGLNVSFCPISKKAVELEPKRSNLRLLWDHASAKKFNANCLSALQLFFSSDKFSKIYKLEKFLVKNEYSEDLVFNLIFNQILICDLDNHKLNADTVVLLNPYFETRNVWKGLINNINSNNKHQ